MKIDQLDDFLGLSKILTGVQDLDQDLGELYLSRLLSTPFDPVVREALKLYRTFKNQPNAAAQVQSKIVADNNLRPAVTQIVLLWYTSAVQDNPALPSQLRYGSQDEFFSGLGWRIIGAHVPGLSGGYFGHWHYRPDNEPA